MGKIESLGPEKFETRFGNLFRTIFCGLTARRSSFCDSSWGAVLLRTNLNLEQRDFEALVAGVRQVGDDQLVLSDVETLPPHQDARIVRCEREAFDTARMGSFLGHVDTVMFGPSGRWGAICSPEYTMLAGDGEFMTTFLRAAGGREALHLIFLEYVARDIDISREFGTKLLSEVGWT